MERRFTVTIATNSAVNTVNQIVHSDDETTMLSYFRCWCCCFLSLCYTPQLSVRTTTLISAKERSLLKEQNPVTAHGIFRQDVAKSKDARRISVVNLFLFGCHVFNRAYVRTRLQIVRVGQGRLSKVREGCLRRVLTNPHLLYWTFTIWSIDSCQNRIATDQYHMTISRAHVSTHRGDVIYLEAVR